MSICTSLKRDLSHLKGLGTICTDNVRNQLSPWTTCSFPWHHLFWQWIEYTTTFQPGKLVIYLNGQTWMRTMHRNILININFIFGEIKWTQQQGMSKQLYLNGNVYNAIWCTNGIFRSFTIAAKFIDRKLEGHSQI